MADTFSVTFENPDGSTTVEQIGANAARAVGIAPASMKKLPAAGVVAAVALVGVGLLLLYAVVKIIKA